MEVDLTRKELLLISDLLEIFALENGEINEKIAFGEDAVKTLIKANDKLLTLLNKKSIWDDE